MHHVVLGKRLHHMYAILSKTCKSLYTGLNLFYSYSRYGINFPSYKLHVGPRLENKKWINKKGGFDRFNWFNEIGQSRINLSKSTGWTHSFRPIEISLLTTIYPFDVQSVLMRNSRKVLFDRPSFRPGSRYVLCFDTIE